MGPRSFPGALLEMLASSCSLWGGFFGKTKSERDCRESLKDCVVEGI